MLGNARFDSFDVPSSKSSGRSLVLGSGEARTNRSHQSRDGSASRGLALSRSTFNCGCRHVYRGVDRSSTQELAGRRQSVKDEIMRRMLNPRGNERGMEYSNVKNKNGKEEVGESKSRNGVLGPGDWKGSFKWSSCSFFPLLPMQNDVCHAEAPGQNHVD